MDENTQHLFEAAQLIYAADCLIICAGAGMGVDSGMPDFRGENGFWRAYPALARANLGFQEIAQPSSFAKHPRLAWGFYGHRLRLYRDTTPHEGFHILLRWAQQKQGGYWVFTSNVDDHFQKVGFSANAIEECHGSIHYTQCVANCCDKVWSAANITPLIDDAHGVWKGALPKCTQCGALLRPNILMFDDWRWNPFRRNYQRNNRTHWVRQRKQQQSKPVILELGAGAAVPAVRRFALNMRKQLAHLDATWIRVNPNEAPDTGAPDICINTGALEALTRIDEQLHKL